MKVSVLLSTFCRPGHLALALRSLHAQNLNGLEYEVIVLNDGVHDETEAIVKRFVRLGMPARYVFTGGRNRDGLQWRVMGFPINIGLRLCAGELVAITSCDVFHLDCTLPALVAAAATDPVALATVRRVYDDDSRVIDALAADDSMTTDDVRALLAGMTPDPNDRLQPVPAMPFCWVLRKQTLVAIGGYDEDFTGIAAEDNDLAERLLASGLHYVHAPVDVVHLYHGRRDLESLSRDPRYQYNVRLWKQRRGTIVRNLGKVWGAWK